MRRFACHHLYVSPVDCCVKYVVEIGENDRVNVCFPLKEEISATRWIGGVIILSPFPELEICAEESFISFLKRVTVKNNDSWYAWHITHFDFAKKDFTRLSRLVRL